MLVEVLLDQKLMEALLDEMLVEALLDRMLVEVGQDSWEGMFHIAFQHHQLQMKFLVSPTHPKQIV